MPRRSARNIAKGTQNHEESETEIDKSQSAVVDVIDEFVAAAEDQEGIENEEGLSKSTDLPVSSEVTEVGEKYIFI